jgi:malate dehydrogenase (oxaloacetate-decarboxylating)(NADP+)
MKLSTMSSRRVSLDCLLWVEHSPRASSRKWRDLTKRPSFSVAQYLYSLTLALSNPSEKSECTFEDAIEWTEGKVLFASGSPFPEATYKGKTYTPGQGNNMYIFPGLGLGTILSQAGKVTDAMILTASESLASCVTEEEFSRGLLYPDISRIREVSLNIASDVIRTAQKDDVDGHKDLRSLSDAELKDFVKSRMYNPDELKHRLEAEFGKH